MSIEKLYEIYQKHPEVTTDSRRCPTGSLFFALRGETFDGNRFANKALEAGAAVAVVDDATIIPQGDNRYFLVPDTLEALQQLAVCHRQHFQGTVIQVTGTNGKTTTKELMAAVLSRKYTVLYTQGNLNNHIGVPLTLLRLKPGFHEMAIIETGANHPGEIAALTKMVDPDYGLITNVGRAHLEGFGSFEGVKSTKGELYDYIGMKERACIFFNVSNKDLVQMAHERHLDDPDYKWSYGKAIAKCSLYGHLDASGKAHIVGEVAACNPMTRVHWRNIQGVDYEVQTRLIGDYNLDNILAAIAVGTHFGVEPDNINAALSDYQPSLGRSEYRKTQYNELIVDAYNANPSSMKAALTNFRAIQHPHKMVILGDMRELGKDSDNAHSQILETLIDSDLEEAWLVGECFNKATQALDVPDGFKLQTFPDVEAVKNKIQEARPVNACILIKGSNSTCLHQLPDLL